MSSKGWYLTSDYHLDLWCRFEKKGQKPVLIWVQTEHWPSKITFYPQVLHKFAKVFNNSPKSHSDVN